MGVVMDIIAGDDLGHEDHCLCEACFKRVNRKGTLSVLKKKMVILSKMVDHQQSIELIIKRINDRVDRETNALDWLVDNCDGCESERKRIRLMTDKAVGTLVDEKRLLDKQIENMNEDLKRLNALLEG